MTQLYFHETQRFNQLWIWILNIGMLGIFIFLFVMQVFLHRPVGEGDSDIWFFFLILIPIGVMILFYRIKLETEIRRDGVYYRFLPFIRRFRHIHWEEMSRCYVRKYNPLMEYGGWGYRTGSKKCTVGHHLPLTAQEYIK